VAPSHFLKNSEYNWSNYYKKGTKSFEFYLLQLEQMLDKAANQEFTPMEDQEHEFRRNIRWMSIYPQASLGMIQLIDSGLSQQATGSYCTEAIANARYNVIPEPGDHRWLLLLEKNYFFSLTS
jgi:hypothetical protein